MKLKISNSWKHPFSSAKDRLGQFVNKSEPPKAIIKWRAPEFYLVKKSIVWGIAITIIFIVLITFFILIGQIFAGVILFLFLILILKYAYSKPEELDYQIDDEGVRVSGWLHPFWQEIIGYWIDTNKQAPILYLRTRSILSERLEMPIKDIKPKKLAKVLTKFIPEYIPPRAPRVASAKR